MSDYPPHIEALRVAALAVSVESYAIRARWSLTPGIERTGACPVCGGKDRFSINTKKNVWNCRGCEKGGKDAISLAMHMESLAFITALERITGRSADETRTENPAQRDEREKRLVQDRARAEEKEKQRAKDAEVFRLRARKAGYKTYNEASIQPWSSVDPVANYLVARGINLDRLLSVSERGRKLHLRQYLSLKYMHRIEENGEKRWKVISRGPAMIAGVTLPGNRFGAVHQTWLNLYARPNFKARLTHPNETDEDGVPLELPSKKVLGTKKGGAILLYTPPNPRRLVAGEGIETTLTVMSRSFEPDTAYWCLVDLGNMAGRAMRGADGRMIPDMPDPDDVDAFVPPEWVQEMIYLGDSDAKTEIDLKKTRDALTRGCRRAMAARPGLKASIAMADRGSDFNDMGRGGTVE